MLWQWDLLRWIPSSNLLLAEVRTQLFPQKWIEHGGSGQLDGVAAGIQIRADVLRRGNAADADEAEL